MEQGAVRGLKGWLLASLATVGCLVLLTGPATSEVVFGAGPGIKASATGTVVHAHLLRNGDMRLVDTEVAFTGSAFDSGGLKAIYNEVGRRVAALNASKTASAVEVGLGVTPPDSNQLILAGKAEAASPQRQGPVTEEVGPIDLAPVAWASLLRGRAVASSDAACTLGRDLGNGLAYVSDVQLLDTGGGAPAASRPASQPSAPANNEPETTSGLPQPVAGLTKGATNLLAPNGGAPAQQQPAPRTATTQAQAAPAEGMHGPLLALDAKKDPRAVSQSFSRTVLVPQRARDGRLLGPNFGIMSEVRQTIAPVTLFAGTPNQTTIEFLGEWVLQVVATGMPGGAFVHYGPGRASPETDVLKIIRPSQTDRILKLQDVLTDEGLVIEIPNLAEIAIGEDPRAIGGSATSRPPVASNGTSASGAVDVLRVRALPGANEIVDARVGHMEATAVVPEGGIVCPIPVAKGSTASAVDVGDSYRQTFTVTNPYDCTLHNVRITDQITTQGFARFGISSTRRTASVATSGALLKSGLVRWDNIGDIPPRGTRTTDATFVARGGNGVIRDRATAVATLADCAEPGATVAGVGVSAVGTRMNGLSRPVEVKVLGAEVARGVVDRDLPHSGAPISLLVAIGSWLLASGGAGLTLAYRMRMR